MYYSSRTIIRKSEKVPILEVAKRYLNKLTSARLAGQASTQRINPEWIQDTDKAITFKSKLSMRNHS